MSFDALRFARSRPAFFETEQSSTGHSRTMGAAFRQPVHDAADRNGDVDVASFDAIYERHFDFIWRALVHLGVPKSSVDDAAQDVFVVVYRRLQSFEGRSSLATWLYGIAIRVARDHRRSSGRRAKLASASLEQIHDIEIGSEEQLARHEARMILMKLLDELDDDKREVFVLGEIEELPAAEIATALGLEMNTVYSRIRLARRAFEKALARHRAREERRAR